MNSDFVTFGDCAARMWMPRWKRVLLDLVCRTTGHLLWRVHANAGFKREGDTLTHNTSHCRRCWQWGYVQGDYKTIDASGVMFTPETPPKHHPKTTRGEFFTDVNGVEIVGP